MDAVIDETDIKDIFDLGTRCITQPLYAFFYTWNPEALQEIQFLEHRFDRQHRSDTPDAEPFSRFDADPSFLSSLRANVSHLAIVRTRGDLEEFRKIEERQIEEGRIEPLGCRWNAYSRMIEDCALLVGGKHFIRLARVRFLSNSFTITSAKRPTAIQILKKLLLVDSTTFGITKCWNRHSFENELFH